ncbi:hypothetical protein BJ508DRAFT_313949 [Ascobolus immersus RN42]|uniref:Uncharacterized protein n=1 Tax=Ascobolus immersus RN42 TaxID=1160509 RepID=A0A3N4HGQ8_ASCIM|nr:hypothetical protein BJ508DRAFT_313949 [Ascobolus immersus RN42]
MSGSPPPHHHHNRHSKRNRDPNEPELSEVQGLSAFIRYRASKNKAAARARSSNSSNPTNSPQLLNPPNPVSRRAAKRAKREAESSPPELTTPNVESEPPVEVPVQQERVESKQERIARLQAELAAELADNDIPLPDAPPLKPKKARSPSVSPTKPFKSTSFDEEIIAYSDDEADSSQPEPPKSERNQQYIYNIPRHILVFDHHVLNSNKTRKTAAFRTARSLFSSRKIGAAHSIETLEYVSELHQRFQASRFTHQSPQSLPDPSAQQLPPSSPLSSVPDHLSPIPGIDPVIIPLRPSVVTAQSSQPFQPDPEDTDLPSQLPPHEPDPEVTDLLTLTHQFPNTSFLPDLKDIGPDNHFRPHKKSSSLSQSLLLAVPEASLGSQQESVLPVPPVDSPYVPELDPASFLRQLCQRRQSLLKPSLPPWSSESVYWKPSNRQASPMNTRLSSWVGTVFCPPFVNPSALPRIPRPRQLLPNKCANARTHGVFRGVNRFVPLIPPMTQPVLIHFVQELGQHTSHPWCMHTATPMDAFIGHTVDPWDPTEDNLMGLQVPALLIPAIANIPIVVLILILSRSRIVRATTLPRPLPLRTPTIVRPRSLLQRLRPRLLLTPHRHIPAWITHRIDHYLLILGTVISPTLSEVSQPHVLPHEPVFMGYVEDWNHKDLNWNQEQDAYYVEDPVANCPASSHGRTKKDNIFDI